MIIHKRYTYDTKSSGLAKKILEAKLRFKDEVAPMVKESVKDRMHYDSKDQICELHKYFRVVENIGYQKGDVLEGYRDLTLKGRQLIVTERSWKFGIDVKVSSLGNIKVEEMLDLEALNRFILTGEYPKTPEK